MVGFSVVVIRGGISQQTCGKRAMIFGIIETVS